MKRKLTLIITLIFAITYFSCSNNGDKKAPKKENVVEKVCYISTYENDTAKMNISYLNNLKVKGTLEIKYGNGAQNNGFIEGDFKGDTLYVYYKFSTANTAMGSFTNPLVFLRKKEQLVMGIGQIETQLGRSYFVKDKPLNFERSKFVFTPTNCK